MTSRRTVLAACGCAAMLAGCQAYGEVAQAPVADGGAANGGGAAPVLGGSASGAPSATAPSATAPSAGAPKPGGAPNPGTAPNPGGAALAQVADIPVGGGKVFPDRKLVVTQPSAGVIKAFSAVCTHQGCLVSGVEAGNIVCPCHGSAFKLADGSVAAGPAKRALPSVAVTISGGIITLG